MNEQFEKWWNEIGSDFQSDQSLMQEHDIALVAWNAAIESVKDKQAFKCGPTIHEDMGWDNE
jgi:hypothetical protein